MKRFIHSLYNSLGLPMYNILTIKVYLTVERRKMFNSIKTVVRSLSFKRGALLIASALALMCASNAMATVTAGVSLTDLTGNINNSVSHMATILTDIALLAGIGFVIASFFKFHQHKLNPTQTSLSQGVTLMLIGAGLMLFPTMLPTASKAVFGPSSKIAQVGGTQIASIVGSGNETN